MKTSTKLLVTSLLALIPTLTSSGAGEVVTSALMTTHVHNGQPVDDVTQVTSAKPNLFYYTRITGCEGCTAVHEWYRNNTLVHRYETTIRYERANWWTKRPGTSLGTWSAIMYLDGEQVHQHVVEFVQSPNREVTVQQAVEAKRRDQCGQSLSRFGTLADETGDPYYRFMYNKWMERCGPVEK